ncbi:S1 RNA-binding domain-containing protein [Amycolatopsis taiwanensis]|uniref:S1 motif domain-containing protein n=1 Tax=Amycolatopsis taiwanensis TaxID=342230 RepID=A0A9W6VH48_9PSEU|nr:S1 RNA-binding domain-containing protein [Amycolatopsis taiwanensis]GLY67117.1 hypothetical protein Atai01_37360 [Amycolatopsis taiwanensis]
MSQPKVSLSEWTEFLAEHAGGGTLSATVTKVLPFGALLEVAPGIHGLLPRSAWSAEPESGSAISVRIANLDVENRRMSFVPA